MKCGECRDGVLVCGAPDGTTYRHLCRACRGHGHYTVISDEELGRARELNRRLKEDHRCGAGFTFIPGELPAHPV